MTAKVEIVTRREQLCLLATYLGVRPDWHEPDEQRITARVEGNEFDNAGFWPEPTAHGTQELHVILSRIYDNDHDDSCPSDGSCGHQRIEDIAAVNLATLLAWATGYREE